MLIAIRTHLLEVVSLNRTLGVYFLGQMFLWVRPLGIAVLGSVGGQAPKSVYKVSPGGLLDAVL